MREALFQIKKISNLAIEIAVTGMHLMPEFGKTINEIKKDKFKIHGINVLYEEDNKESMANFIGKMIQLLIKKVKKIKPDMILLLGDRGEMLAGAIVGGYWAIPVADTHGGDVSFSIDEISRHAITKLSHLHFAATKNAAKRLIKLGEDSWRVFIAGAPGLDGILDKKPSSEKIAKKYKLDLSKPILIVLQHPLTLEIEDAGKQMKETMEAIRELNCQAIVIYPNADAGGRKMIRIIREYEKYPFIKIFKNIPRQEYLGLMKIADVLVGNSSSGIIEAPYLHLPAVNIGQRQRGRERAENIIDVNHNKAQIKLAIKKALYDKKFKEKVRKCENPYGEGRAGVKIANVLKKKKINRKLLQKKITY